MEIFPFFFSLEHDAPIAFVAYSGQSLGLTQALASSVVHAYISHLAHFFPFGSVAGV